MNSSIVTILEYAYVAIICLMTAQAIFTIRLRLYIWEEPERSGMNSVPSEYREPQLSFTILLPAYHEEELFADTIQKVYDLNYPRHLVQIMPLLREHDTGTVKVTQEKLQQLRAPNVEMLVTNDRHGGKPHQLNLGLKVARGDIVTIFDAEDEPHPDILQVVNTIFLDESPDAVQSGVQLMNHNTKWFCFLNVLEYFFWFKSSLHFFARCGMTPLGGNTVFLRRRLLERLGGWDHTILTEDADLGIRLSIAKANVRILYDDEFVTKEETPHTIDQFIKQRARWNQGFIQILLRGRWLKLPKPSQKLLALYVLIMPEILAFFTLMLPVAIVALLFIRLPIWMAILTFMPLYCFILAMFIDLAGLHEFVKVHNRRWKWREALTLLLAWFPYQWLEGMGALRAMWRQLLGASNWEKTAHIGQHKAINHQIQPMPSFSPSQPDEDKAASLTLVHASNFFVDAFASPLQANSTAIAGIETNPLEEPGWNSAAKQLPKASVSLLQQRDTFTKAAAEKRRVIPLPGWVEGLGVLVILGCSLAFQALEMFHPQYQAAEGTLMANTEALLHGRITPYAYDYSLPPLGWIQIAAWVKLTGGIASFGNAINSGRVLMLVMAAISSLLLYLVTSRMSGSRGAGLLAMVLYTLSPLSLIYRDQILPYNIGILWLLLSLWLVTYSKSRLGMFALAAAALSIAILSDGLFLIFLPVMLYAVAVYATPFQRKFSQVAFAYVTLAMSSVYVLLAVLRSEFLPSGSSLAHPSLLGTAFLTLQSEFLPSGNFLINPSLIEAFFLKTQVPLADQQASAIWQGWFHADPLLIVVGTAAMFLNVLVGIGNRFQLLAALLGGTFWAFLVIINVWNPYSIVVLLPFLALNIALAVNTPLRWLTRPIRFDFARVMLLFALLGLLVPLDIQYARPLLAPNGSEPQQQAMTWVSYNVPRNAVIITGSYMYADLVDPQGMAVGGGTPFTKAQIFTDAALDPAIAQKLLKEQWQSIDFLVVDPSMLTEIRTDRRFTLLNEALHHATLRISFGSSQDGTQIQIYQVIPV